MVKRRFTCNKGIYNIINDVYFIKGEESANLIIIGEIVKQFVTN
jgi:hypothetical protein